MNTRQMIEMEQEEMRKHRWIESEKAHRDLGQSAYFDWIKKYAKKWREWFEITYGS